jgi:hypothetical protein
VIAPHRLIGNSIPIPRRFKTLFRSSAMSRRRDEITVYIY